MHKRKWGMLALITAVLLVVVIALLVQKNRPTKNQNGETSPGPWQVAQHPFDPRPCLQGKCEEMLRLPMAGTQGLSFMVDPAVDDEVAQWADCLTSIATCIEQQEALTVPVFHDCISHSACPSSCKDGFNNKTSQIKDVAAMMVVFDAFFVGETGACVPR